MKTPTSHNEAKFGDIAKTVLMPGDPLRAKYIADNYLTDVICYNEVRLEYGFTGMYKGHRISIQSSGMGIPSMGIYSHELYNAYGVENIIRIGSAGGLREDIKLRDIVIASTVDTDSNYLKLLDPDGFIVPCATSDLLETTLKVAKDKDINVKVGKVFTSILFYNDEDNLKKLLNEGMIAVEMETLALYINAAKASKNAIAMFTISDLPLLGDSVTNDEKEKDFNDMIKLALDMAVEYENKV